MAGAYHSFANHASALFMRLLFGSVAQIHLIRVENANRPGGMILAGNHISHFDPLILSGVVRRKIDWMTMAEFFPIPVVGQWLHAVDAFPADRHRANSTTVRTTVDRLRNGRLVGIFPEGGIRDGKSSILEGAPVRSGIATLADMAAVPILPCVILGSDRLYNRRRWIPFRRTPIWIGFAEPIYRDPNLDRKAARERIEQQFALALSSLLAELRQTFGLSEDDLPHPPRQRMHE
jgi:1-acyl-sn-glycerol-3-phosphate acyltransferase